MTDSATQTKTQPLQPLLTLPQRVARKTLFALLAQLQQGQLNIRDAEGLVRFGQGQPSATLEVLDGAFYTRVLLGGSIGAGEGYVDGLWRCDDLTALVRIMVLNLPLLDGLERRLAWLTWPLQRLKHLANRNSKRGSKKNILAHYDLGNALYERFLDPTMMYSSALYPHAEASLEEAQRHRLDRICTRLDLKPGDRLLEIGTGWGGLAIHAARHYGCHVTTTTISDAQYEEAARRVAEAGLEDSICLLKEDYRELGGQYDKLVSIEMIEAVGHGYLPGFFKKCQSLLKDDGLMLLQAITISDQRYDSYARSVDFIQRHIFPGGCLPSNTRMLSLMTAHTDLVVRDLLDFGFDYARTLREWRRRFHGAFEELRQLGYDERFRRLWDYYFCYCEGGFMERAISVVQLVATRPGNRTCLSG
ncbi:cyclopropane-fatty-acyl-phospholipid synthase [Gallaecimonas kandeliae]|uniref:SAM-dependent methyltransferase n=1 Tax=Gallaecimonas kandeliae TaxID=3029055 RepID=UPI002647D65F|nr:cyclopropane-fatty-acyl-phospholipid synthase family protein [Gallaecimonas kandeliae]WKE63940.1 cyclopropane-fatty-acyl-phospholipid synthase [Gallaecimonas kandeliae]